MFRIPTRTATKYASFMDFDMPDIRKHPRTLRRTVRLLLIIPRKERAPEVKAVYIAAESAERPQRMLH
ncbi:MAG: hypothetical protein RLZZ227_1285 [Pseudomonadota bacterium]|jgi:hypothetical protein